MTNRQIDESTNRRIDESTDRQTGAVAAAPAFPLSPERNRIATQTVNPAVGIRIGHRGSQPRRALSDRARR